MTIDRLNLGLPMLAVALVTGILLGGAGAPWLRYGAEIFLTYATGMGIICM